MAVRRASLHRTRRKIALGDLRDRVRVQVRSLTPPVAGVTNFTEDFNEKDGIEVWAKVATVSGRTFFDGVNSVDISVSHEITIRFRSDIEAQNWLELLNGTKLKIVNVENFEQRDEYLRLLCTERGHKTLGAAQA